MRSRRSVFPTGRAGETLPLPFEPVAPASVPASPPLVPGLPSDVASEVRKNSPQRLWLALYFPDFVLAAHQGFCVADAFAVIAEQRGQSVVATCNFEAQELGIQHGMTLAGALALAPALSITELQSQCLERMLTELAVVAERYTSCVVTVAPDQLLLEIGASLTLFGGWDNFQAQLSASYLQQGLSFNEGLAPTPQAAQWLARCRPGSVVTSSAEIASALRDIPLTMIEWPADILRRFQSVGVTTLGECRRLPRAGFARRFGPAQLLMLDRAYGLLPDPRPLFRGPESFTAELELSGEIENADLLFEAAAILVDRLDLFLRHRQWQTREFELAFFPLKGEPDHIVIRPADGAQASSHWLNLIRIRLERCPLKAPAIAVGLRSSQFEPVVPESRSLTFKPGPDAFTLRSASDVLLERLMARLGEAAVCRMSVIADARPEFAMRLSCANQIDRSLHCAANSPWQVLPLYRETKLTTRLCLQRPLWLLEVPREFSQLSADLGQICLQSEAERIESGWWDGLDMARDYYQASTDSGARLWVFRERLSRHDNWYLHGYFG